MHCTSCGDPAAAMRRLRPVLDDARRPASSLLLLVAERIDESLVLLQREYGLRMAEVLYATRNVGAYRRERDPALAACLRSINPLDAALYAAALTAFDRRVVAHGAGFADNVALFRRLSAQAAKGCTDRGGWGCAAAPPPAGRRGAACGQCAALHGRVDAERTLVSHFAKCA